MSTNPAEGMYCRTCRGALSVRLNAGTVTVVHVGDLQGRPVTDHNPDPVHLADLPDALRICDVCSSPEVTYIYDAADQTMEQRRVTAIALDRGEYRDRHLAARQRRVVTEHGQTIDWGGLWTVCGPCAEHIEQRDLLGLLRRATDSFPPKLRQGKRLVQARADLHGVYSHLLDTRTPGRWRITPEHPLGIHEPDPATRPGDGVQGGERR